MACREFILTDVTELILMILLTLPFKSLLVRQISNCTKNRYIIKYFLKIDKDGYL